MEHGLDALGAQWGKAVSEITRSREGVGQADLAMGLRAFEQAAALTIEKGWAPMEAVKARVFGEVADAVAWEARMKAAEGRWEDLSPLKDSPTRLLEMALDKSASDSPQRSWLEAAVLARQSEPGAPRKPRGL